ncbi:phytanoyl-CoA dioxygenase family protein [Hyphococcus luteus]|uniref:Phytanoyl-CoA dioxygenase family protein n=1 Tax=Hyphococcus luteus TaxID=2058213 RepID=A0A2S7JZ33_9PROT|nr:phytanoyl-CoA dioxygenase family protein [Marinicaulis flavus]PQA85513.1 phytanoyl-CoA dioxygenase family protein [Marinicaulis flavus]
MSAVEEKQPVEYARWLGGRDFDDWREEFDREGYLIFKNVLSGEQLAAIKAALAPYLDQNVRGRNEFEGRESNRVYAMLAKSPVFADLVTHPLAMAFAEADLGPDCLLSACLAINLHPGETAQPWHFDDSHCGWPRPRPSLGVSTFWAITDTMETNGATEILPGSHLWAEDHIEGAIAEDDFSKTGKREGDPGFRPDAVKAVMPAGSLMVAKGTLWHRGGANVSDQDRLLITPQYCPGWTRPLENMSLAVPPAIARTLPVRAQELLGYSIHPPFMGYVDGRHPKRLLGD